MRMTKITPCPNGGDRRSRRRLRPDRRMRGRCAAPRGADGSQEPVAAATVTVARITAPPANGTTAPEPTFTSTPTVLKGIGLATAVPVGTKLVKDDDDGSPTRTVTVHAVKQWICIGWQIVPDWSSLV